jgi:hypothetical protein
MCNRDDICTMTVASPHAIVKAPFTLALDTAALE